MFTKFKRSITSLAILAGLGIPAALGAAYVAPGTAHATFSCSGQSGHDFYDANQAQDVEPNGQQGVILSGGGWGGNPFWWVYYDNNPSSPEYQMYSVCTETGTGGWLTWVYNSQFNYYALYASASSPWTNPGYSFFKPDCLGDSAHTFYALFTKEDGSGATSEPNPPGVGQIGVNLTYWDKWEISGICGR